MPISTHHVNVAEYADMIASSLGSPAVLPAGAEEYEKQIKHPTTEEILALQRVQDRLPAGAVAALVRVTYFLSADGDYDDVCRTEIRLDIKVTGAGTETRYLLVK